MPVKRVWVLANSIKLDSRCIAGREIVQRNGRIEIGPWVRPVSNHGEGEIGLWESALADGSQPKMLDVVDIPVTGPCSDPCQPENWHLDSKQRWRRVQGLALPPIASCEDHPIRLWWDPGSRSDEISAELVRRYPPQHSLYLIRPSEFRMELSTEFNTFERREQHRRRAVFVYNRIHYDFAITDPALDRKYFWTFPAVGEGVKTMELACGNNCLLGVSLTHDFHGRHYKLVASVIEL